MDKISDFIIRLKNAGNAGRVKTVLPYSKVNLAIAELLEKKKYIKSQTKKGKEGKMRIEAELIQTSDGRPRIQGVKRHSKPSKRVYAGKEKIYSVRQGHGMLVLSTSKGVMSGDEAKKTGVGGESLFEIW